MSRVKSWLRRLFGRTPAPKLTAEEKRRERKKAKRERVAVILDSDAADAPFAASDAIEVHRAATADEQDAILRATRAPLILFATRGKPPREEHLRALIAQLSGITVHALAEAPGYWPLWRRDALLQAGGVRAGLEAARGELHQLGWELPGQSRIYPWKSNYYPGTLFLTLSGRAWAWPLTAGFLERQTFDHGSVELCVLDTSGDAVFGEKVQRWLADCDYSRSHYLTRNTGLQGLADRPRADVLDEVRHAVAANYNVLKCQNSGDLVFFLEDDVVPPDDAYSRLAALLKARQAADARPVDAEQTKHQWPLARGSTFSAAAVVRGRHERYRRGEPIAWRWTESGEREHLPHASGVQSIGGNGFGCTVIEGYVVRQHVFLSGPPYDDFDINFYYEHVARRGYKALIDWDCICRHHDSAEQWV